MLSGAATACLLPWILFVALSGGLVGYFQTASEFAAAEASASPQPQRLSRSLPPPCGVCDPAITGPAICVWEPSHPSWADVRHCRSADGLASSGFIGAVDDG